LTIDYIRFTVIYMKRVKILESFSKEELERDLLSFIDDKISIYSLHYSTCSINSINSIKISILHSVLIYYVTNDDIK